MTYRYRQRQTETDRYRQRQTETYRYIQGQTETQALPQGKARQGNAMQGWSGQVKARHTDKHTYTKPERQTDRRYLQERDTYI